MKYDSPCMFLNVKTKQELSDMGSIPIIFLSCQPFSATLISSLVLFEGNKFLFCHLNENAWRRTTKMYSNICSLYQHCMYAHKLSIIRRHVISTAYLVSPHEHWYTVSNIYCMYSISFQKHMQAIKGVFLSFFFFFKGSHQENIEQTRLRCRVIDVWFSSKQTFFLP